MDHSELESHLADRLAETRDVAAFSRRDEQAGSDSVERQFELPGHLGGRRVSDKFTRSRAPAKPKGLEHHLKSRLAEVTDALVTEHSAVLEAARAQAELRRRLGGS